MDKDRLGDVDILRSQIGLDIGLTGSLGEIRAGAFANWINTKPDLGIVNYALEEESVRQTGFSFLGICDQLDSPVFPRSGIYARGEIKNAYQSGDVSEDYARAHLFFTGAKSFGKNTLAGTAEWGDFVNGTENLSAYDAFQLGGPNRLSGLYLVQLTGTDFSLFTLKYYRRFASLPPQLGRGLYFGGSLETGRIDDEFMDGPWDWVAAGSFFLGADTRLGAFYLGYGYASLGQGALYMVIGPQF